MRAIDRIARPETESGFPRDGIALNVVTFDGNASDPVPSAAHRSGAMVRE